MKCKPDPEIIKVGVVTIDVSSIGTKFENFVQAGCRDLGSHCGRTVRMLPKAHCTEVEKSILMKNLKSPFSVKK